MHIMIFPKKGINTKYFRIGRLYDRKKSIFESTDVEKRKRHDKGHNRHRKVLQIYQSAKDFRHLRKRQADKDKWWIGRYLDYFIDALVLSKAQRYDIKVRRYIGSPLKYYYSDIGWQNARLNFRLRTKFDWSINSVKPLCHKAKSRSIWKSNFGDALRITQDRLDSKNFYAVNPSFDK